MPPLSASAILDIWERGAGRAPVEQALAILEVAFPQAGRDVLADLSVPERDACLLHLREATFGPRLNGLANCPACGERLELSFETPQLLPPGAPPPGPQAPAPHNPQRSFRLDGCSVAFRLPTSADLLAVAALTDPGQARRQLLQACLLSARRGGKPLPVQALPEKVLAAAVEHMGQADPLVDLNLAVACPACNHQWALLFDIVSFFWGEISAWAVRLMHEVHLLASAYGWREADILAMSAWRRRGYLELIGT